MTVTAELASFLCTKSGHGSAKVGVAQIFRAFRAITYTWNPLSKISGSATVYHLVFGRLGFERHGIDANKIGFSRVRFVFGKKQGKTWLSHVLTADVLFLN